MIERLRLKPRDPVVDLIRRGSKRRADLDLRGTPPSCPILAATRPF
jgi:hypothetical protein